MLQLLLCAFFLLVSVTGNASWGDPASVKIMPLGDSITQNDPGYRGPLFDLLTSAGYKVEFVGSNAGDSSKCKSPHHEGHGGFTIGPGKSKADGWTNGKGNIFDNVDTWLKIQPDIVLLTIGVNEYFNVGDLQPGYDPNAQGPAKLAGLLDKIHAASPGSKILVSSLLPVGWDSHFAEPFNAAIPGIVAARPFAVFVDLNKTTAFSTGDWSGDNLHPSDKGFQKMASAWFQALKTVLPNPPTHL